MTSSGFEWQCFHEQTTWPWSPSQPTKWLGLIIHLVSPCWESVAFTSTFYCISFSETVRSFQRFRLMVFTISSHFWHYAFQMEIACLTHKVFLSSVNVFTVQIGGEKCQWSSDSLEFVCLSQGKGACERWRDWYGASDFWLLLECGSSIPEKIFHLARCRASWQTAACTAGAPNPHSSCSMC